MITKYQVSEEPITSGDFCKDCIHCILVGNPKHGPEMFARFCGEESNLIEEEDFTTGIRTFFAELCSEHNPAGTCGDYSES